MEANMYCVSFSDTVLDVLSSTLSKEVSNLAKIASLREGRVRIQSKVTEALKSIQILSFTSVRMITVPVHSPEFFGPLNLPFFLFSLLRLYPVPLPPPLYSFPSSFSFSIFLYI